MGREETCHLSSILASLNLGSLALAVGLAAQGTDGSVGCVVQLLPGCLITAGSPVHSGGRHTHTSHMHHKCPGVLRARTRYPRPGMGQSFPGKNTELGVVSLRCSGQGESKDSSFQLHFCHQVGVRRWAGHITHLSLALLAHSRIPNSGSCS